MKATIKHVIAHRVGNKLRGEGVGFSSKEMEVQGISDALSRLIDKSFKGNDYYHFSGDLEVSPVYTFAKGIFGNPTDFKTQSNHIAKTLYESSVHPKIKTGELCVIYMTDVEFEDTLVDAIAIIKAESHQEVLQFDWGENGYIARKSIGISLSKIDKGALIFNVSVEDGYKVLVVDKVSRSGDAKYWKDSFLRIMSYNGGHHQTTNLVDICNEFVNAHIKDDDSLTRLEKAMIASRVKDVLLQSNAESMTIEEYAKAVFKDDALITKFNEYVDSSDKNAELNIESISIDKQAVVKRKNSVSTIKLDNNFELYINGAEDRISKGYDSDAALNYYKLYFEKEQ